MTKKYIIPEIKVRKVNFESALLDISLNGDNPSSGLPGEDNPTSGGTSTGGSAGDAGSKSNIWSRWDTEED